MTLKIAHRGATTNAPENSILATEHAIAAGADAVEIDVRLCGTGEVIVLHDPTLTRMLGVPDRASQTSLSVIKHISFKDMQFEHIPTLREMLEHFGAIIRFNIEIKEHRIRCAEIVEKVSRVITDLKLEDSVWISSFNPFVIRTIKQLSPHLKAGYLYDKVRYLPTLLTDYYNIEAWHPHYSLVNEEYVRVARQRGKEIYCWTVNEKSETDRLISLGIDGIITDNLSLFETEGI